MKIPITDRANDNAERGKGNMNETQIGDMETEQQESLNEEQGTVSSSPETVGENNAEASVTEDTETVESVKAEYEDRLLRLAAEFENYKRLAARRESDARERAVRGVFEDLLPVLDNFDRAVQAAQNATSVDSLRVGVTYILQQLEDSLRGHGIEPIPAAGQPFDPLRHDALEEIADTGEQAGTVIEEVQRGYVYKGQVLRPARVKVAG
jgi:molecular chaperone GrpE